MASGWVMASGEAFGCGVMACGAMACGASLVVTIPVLRSSAETREGAEDERVDDVDDRRALARSAAPKKPSRSLSS